MIRNRVGTSSSAARSEGESSSDAGRASPERPTRAPQSLGHVEGLEPRRRTALQPTTAEVPPRATLPAATGAKLPDLPRDLWRNVVGRLDARAALALSSTDKTWRAATDSIAVAQAVTTSPHLPAAAHHGLRKAAAIPDTDADLRLDILRSVAGRIGGSAEQAVGLVLPFLRAIGSLPPAPRVDARAVLEEALAGLPEQDRSAAFTVAKHSDELEEIDKLSDVGERTVRLTALAEQVSSMRDTQVRLAMLGGLVDKVGQLPGLHRAEALTVIAEALTAVVLQLAASGPSEAFDRAWNHAMSLAEAATAQQREQIATLLADKISNLTPAARQEAFDRTIASLGFTPLLGLVGKQDQVDSMALKYLADRLSTLPETELQSAWKVMRSLASQMQLSGADLVAKDAVIAALAGELPRLKSKTQAEAVELVQDGIWELRIRDNTGSRSLAKLASAIPALPEKLRQDAFETVLNRVEVVFAADDSLESRRDDDGRTWSRGERGAALLGQLAQAAGSLPGLAPRAAVSEILSSMRLVSDDASRAETLKLLARHALPAALERPVPLIMRASNRRKLPVSRESLLQSFAKQVEWLPPKERVPTLQHMLQEASVYADGKSSRSSGDKRGKLPAILEELMHKAARELDATVPGG